MFKKKRKPEEQTKSDAPKTVVYKVPTCEDRLAHMVKLGFSPKVIYDCGAFIGRWTKETYSLLPDSDYVLIEPNPNMKEEIDSRTEDFKEQVHYFDCAVGAEPGKAHLNVWANARHTNKTTSLAASSLLDHIQGDPSESHEVEVKAIDQIARETSLWPDLLKLDLQGAEKDALLGAGDSLERAEVVITEFGVLDAYIGRTACEDLFSILSGKGFRLYDIVDLRYRPFDGALAGGDFIFVKKSSSLCDHKDYF